MIKRVCIKSGEPYDFYGGRENKYWNLPGSKWGNPFVLKREADRPEILAKYRQHVLNSPELYDNLEELDGKVGACWCPLHKRCHLDELNDLLEEKKNGKGF